jgi:hypothetical protein
VRVVERAGAVAGFAVLLAPAGQAVRACSRRAARPGREGRDEAARLQRRGPLARLDRMDDDRVSRIAALLHEAGETHHLVYRIVDGDDPDWASWYADWLIGLSELPQILGTTPVRSELVWLLVQLDKDYSAASPDDPWPQWYAQRILAQHGSVADPS